MCDLANQAIGNRHQYNICICQSLGLINGVNPDFVTQARAPYVCNFHRVQVLACIFQILGKAHTHFAACTHKSNFCHVFFLSSAGPPPRLIHSK